jgi:DNA-directed RNA polymerase subunit omega
MIEALKSDTIVDKVGGKFKLCTLIQKRVVQLMDGARPLVERHGRSDLEIAIEEILQDKITLHQPSDRELAAANAEAQGELEGALL